jgi:hypothetical protein
MWQLREGADSFVTLKVLLHLHLGHWGKGAAQGARLRPRIPSGVYRSLANPLRHLSLLPRPQQLMHLGTLIARLHGSVPAQIKVRTKMRKKKEKGDKEEA